MTIESRIAMLERANRRWRMLAVSLIGILCFGVFAAAGPSTGKSLGSVTIDSLHLVDSKGNERALLGITDDRVGFTLMDENNQHQVLLAVDQKASEILIGHKKEGSSSVIKLNAGDDSELKLVDHRSGASIIVNGQGVAQNFATGDGSGSVTIKTDNNETALMLTNTKSEQAAIVVKTQSGTKLLP